MIRLAVLAAATAITALLASSAAAGGAGGVTGPAFYVDGSLYRTVGTPTDLSGTGAPARSFDMIYAFGGHQTNVATAAPGDPGYNGGRWRVLVLGFPSGYGAALGAADTNESGDIDSDEELATAFAAGKAAIAGAGPSFVCPVIKLSRGS
jgi:hypothetical protein